MTLFSVLANVHPMSNANFNFSHASQNKPSPQEWQVDKFLSGPFTWGFLALGEGLPFLERDRNPTQEGLRSGDSELFAVGIAEGLKRLTRVPRPDTGEPDSFPSGHATASFAMAAAQAQFHPGQALYWYFGASLISISRIRLNRHHVTDVLAGATLGIIATRIELSQPRGLILNPFILEPTRELQLKSSLNSRSPWTYVADPLLHRYGIAYATRF